MHPYTSGRLGLSDLKMEHKAVPEETMEESASPKPQPSPSHHHDAGSELNELLLQLQDEWGEVEAKTAELQASRAHDVGSSSSSHLRKEVDADGFQDLAEETAEAALPENRLLELVSSDPAEESESEPRQRGVESDLANAHVAEVQDSQPKQPEQDNEVGQADSQAAEVHDSEPEQEAEDAESDLPDGQAAKQDHDAVEVEPAVRLELEAADSQDLPEAKPEQAVACSATGDTRLPQLEEDASEVTEFHSDEQEWPEEEQLRAEAEQAAKLQEEAAPTSTPESKGAQPTEESRSSDQQLEDEWGEAEARTAELQASQQAHGKVEQGVPVKMESEVVLDQKPPEETAEVTVGDESRLESLLQPDADLPEEAAVEPQQSEDEWSEAEAGLAGEMGGQQQETGNVIEIWPDIEGIDTQASAKFPQSVAEEAPSPEGLHALDKHAALGDEIELQLEDACSEGEVDQQPDPANPMHGVRKESEPGSYQKPPEETAEVASPESGLLQHAAGYEEGAGDGTEEALLELVDDWGNADSVVATLQKQPETTHRKPPEETAETTPSPETRLLQLASGDHGDGGYSSEHIVLSEAEIKEDAEARAQLQLAQEMRQKGAAVHEGSLLQLAAGDYVREDDSNDEIVLQLEDELGEVDAKPAGLQESVGHGDAVIAKGAIELPDADAVAGQSPEEIAKEVAVEFKSCSSHPDEADESEQRSVQLEEEVGEASVRSGEPQPRHQIHDKATQSLSEVRKAYELAVPQKTPEEIAEEAASFETRLVQHASSSHLDEGGGSELQQLEDEWGEVEARTAELQAIQQQGQGTVTQGTGTEEPISWHEMQDWLTHFHIDPVVLEPLREAQMPSSSACSCMSGTRSKADIPGLRGKLLKEKDLVLCLKLTEFDLFDTTHFRMLRTLYTKLTRSKACPTIGSHWEVLGFQSNDPRTDLNRSGGVLNILHLLWLTKPQYLELLKSTFQLSQDPIQEFPLACVSINITSLVLEALMSGRLSNRCNKMEEVLNTTCHLHAAGLWYFAYRWRTLKRTISDHEATFKEVQSQMMRPAKLVSMFDKAVLEMSRKQDASKLEFTNLDFGARGGAAPSSQQQALPKRYADG